LLPFWGAQRTMWGRYIPIYAAGVGDGMIFYKTAKWKNKREKILRRDEYLCQECRRYGRTTPATTVHHIHPAEKHPEWKLASWNMISLCHECHNKMHDRDNGALTALGQSWVDRVPPPP
jgi:5-methylcytosine-specific restriction protein A